MCVYSMVMDHFEPQFPYSVTSAAPIWVPGQISEAPSADWLRLIEDMKKAAEAAEVVDEMTGQPDCVDQEKQKLEQRVADLEAPLANAPEFVIVEGGGLEPGTYRVLEGKLYRAV